MNLILKSVLNYLYIPCFENTSGIQLILLCLFASKTVTVLLQYGNSYYFFSVTAQILG